MRFVFIATSGNIAVGQTLKAKDPDQTVVDIRWRDRNLTPTDIEELDTFIMRLLGVSPQDKETIIEPHEPTRQQILDNLTKPKSN